VGDAKVSGEDMQASLDLCRKHKAILAGFGTRALDGINVDALLQEACDLAVQGVGPHCKSKVLVLLPDEQRMLTKAGTGWKPGTVGNLTVGADPDSAGGYALRTADPVIAQDVPNETRFRIPPSLFEYGIKSMINVNIRVQGRTYGLLEVDSEMHREFSADESDFLQGLANILGAAIHQHQQGELLRNAVHDRELLLRELQHRVKNNLQIIGSLVSIQKRKASSAETVEHLNVIGNRIGVLSLLHDQLYARSQSSEIDLADYLAQLATRLVDLQDDDTAKVALSLTLEPIVLGLDKVVPLGLIVNEFITNSLKHAFPNRSGTISLNMRRAGETLHLRLADDGIGKSPDQTQNETNSGTGIDLIAILARQIDAELVHGRSQGTSLQVIFQIGDGRGTS